MDSGLTTITVILILGILGGVLYLIGAGALDEIDRDSDDFDLYDTYKDWGEGMMVTVSYAADGWRLCDFDSVDAAKTYAQQIATRENTNMIVSDWVTCDNFVLVPERKEQG